MHNTIVHPTTRDALLGYLAAAPDPLRRRRLENYMRLMYGVRPGTTAAMLWKLVAAGHVTHLGGKVGFYTLAETPA